MATTTRPIKGSSPGDYAAYLQDAERTANYYDEADGFDKVWGQLAPELGLERGTSLDQWSSLYMGEWEGQKLTKPVKDRIPAQDMTISLPKSVGELLVAADPELRKRIIEEVIWPSAKEAFDYLERTTPLARIQSKVLVGDHYETIRRRYPARLLCTPALQYSARPTPQTIERGAPADVSVHIHLAIMSAVKVGDRWLSADSWGLKKNAEHIDQVMSSEMIRRLEGLGIAVEYLNEFGRARGGKVRWEVAGSSKEARDHWSSNTERKRGIEKAFEDENGRPITDRELRQRMYLTRSCKTAADKEQDSAPVWERWADDLADAEIALMKVKQRGPIEHNPFVEQKELRRRLMGSQGLIRDDSVFTEATVGQAIRRCAVGLGFNQRKLAGLEHILLTERSDLVPVRASSDPEERLWTTSALLEAEDRVAHLRDAKRHEWVDVTGKAGTGKSRLTATAVEAIRSLEGAPIAEAVKAAIERQDVRLDDEQVAGVRAIVEAGKGADQIICVSMAASTAERTGQKIKADAWGSVESIVSRIDKGQLKITARTLLVIEESGQLDTLRADLLLQKVKDARIVTLGDTRQLSAIGASGWYADALDRHGSIELTEVRRQKDARDIEAYALVRDGKAAKALQDLAERGRVHVSVSNADRMGQVFEDYRGQREAGRLARDVRIVLDASNAEVDVANRFVQRDRLQRAEISDRAVEVEHDESGRRWALHDNDQVIMLSAVRERGQKAIKNGSTGVIQGVDPANSRVRVLFDDGHEANLPATAAIGLAYGVHIAKFQGGECPVALCVPGAQTTRNSAYTMLTRSTEESHLYASVETHGSVEGLGKLMSKADAKESARKAIERARRAAVDLPEPSLEPIPDLDTIDFDPAVVGERERPSVADLRREALEMMSLNRDVLEHSIEDDGLDLDEGWTL